MSEMFVWLHIIFNANTNLINRHKGKRPTTSATAYTASVHFYTPKMIPICVQWMTCDVVDRHCTYTHTGRSRDALQSAAGPLTPLRPRFSLSLLHFFLFFLQIHLNMHAYDVNKLYLLLHIHYMQQTTVQRISPRTIRHVEFICFCYVLKYFQTASTG